MRKLFAFLTVAMLLCSPASLAYAADTVEKDLSGVTSGLSQDCPVDATIDNDTLNELGLLGTVFLPTDMVLAPSEDKTKVIAEAPIWAKGLVDSASIITVTVEDTVDLRNESNNTYHADVRMGSYNESTKKCFMGWNAGVLSSNHKNREQKGTVLQIYIDQADIKYLGDFLGSLEFNITTSTISEICKQGLASSCFNIGDLMFDGKFRIVDIEKAGTSDNDFLPAETSGVKDIITFHATTPCAPAAWQTDTTESKSFQLSALYDGLSNELDAILPGSVLKGNVTINTATTGQSSPLMQVFVPTADDYLSHFAYFKNGGKLENTGGQSYFFTADMSREDGNQSNKTILYQQNNGTLSKQEKGIYSTIDYSHAEYPYYLAFCIY